MHVLDQGRPGETREAVGPSPSRRLLGVLRPWRRPAAEDRERLVGLDVARCLALLGMMVVHVVPKAVNGRVPWQQVLASGRASGLFAVLAGSSLALMSGRTSPVTGSRRWAVSRGIVVRAALITALGLGLDKLHDANLGVILPYYGLLFLLGLPFLGLRPRQLFVLAGVAAVTLPVLSQLVRPHLGAPGSEKLSHMSPLELAAYLGLTGDYPAVPWLAFLLTGLGLGRLALDSRRRAVQLVAAGAALALGATLLSGLLTGREEVRRSLVTTWPDGGLHPSWSALQVPLRGGLSGTTPTGSWWWLAVVAPHSGTPLDLVQTIGCALVVIGLCLLLARWRPRVWQVAFGAGAMTLTLYALHLVMLRPDVLPDLGAPRFWPEALVVLVVGAGFAAAGWRGPFEGLLTLAARSAAGLRLGRRRR